MTPLPQQFTGVVVVIGAQAFLQINTPGGVRQELLLKGPSPSLPQQIAAATALFLPVNGTLQAVTGTAVSFGGQGAILIP